MTLSLLGYLPKKRTPTPEGWTANPVVEEICSVSHCMAAPPDGWVDRWLQNDWGFCNSISAARSLIPPDTTDYDIFGFALFPERFSHGQRLPIDLAAPPWGQLSSSPAAPEPLPETFASLGYDAVSNYGHSVAYFECSPLSCNYMAESIPVNSFCLMSDLEQAVAAALQFSLEQPEPGDYFVFQVFREHGSQRTARDGSPNPSLQRTPPG